MIALEIVTWLVYHRAVEFRHAIVRTPARTLASGLSTAGLGLPDYHKALAQHRAYVNALRVCGLSVTILDPLDAYPDSTFVEDTALLTREFAILTRPGAPSRMGETAAIEKVLSERFSSIAHVNAPGTVDAGDIMMVGSRFYIGLSSRTNESGAEQVVEILKSHGREGIKIPLSGILHLKSAVAYLEPDTIVASRALAPNPAFKEFRKIEVPDDESYAANCLWLNGSVLVVSGFPKTLEAIRSAGYDSIALDVSEFQKLDGGLSCLSLRY